MDVPGGPLGVLGVKREFREVVAGLAAHGETARIAHVDQQDLEGIGVVLGAATAVGCSGPQR